MKSSSLALIPLLALTLLPSVGAVPPPPALTSTATDNAIPRIHPAGNLVDGLLRDTGSQVFLGTPLQPGYPELFDLGGTSVFDGRMRVMAYPDTGVSLSVGEANLTLYDAIRANALYEGPAAASQNAILAYAFSDRITDSLVGLNAQATSSDSTRDVDAVRAFTAAIPYGTTNTVGSLIDLHAMTAQSFGSTLGDAYGLKVEDVSAASAGHNYAIKTGQGTVSIGDTLILAKPHTPASAVEPCAKGTVTWDGGFVYVCIDTDRWARSPLAAW